MNEIIGIILIAVIFIGIFVSISIVYSVRVAFIVFSLSIILTALIIIGVSMTTGDLKLF